MDAIVIEKLTGIWPSVCDTLSNKFQILEAINLLRYDHDMMILWKKLHKYKEYTFNDDQRLIFSFYDTEYYFSNSKLGFTIENLIVLLKDLDISLGHCILFTNHHGITSTINLRCYNDWPIVVFENNYSVSQSTDVQFNINRSSEQINNHFCFMSNVKRDHRSYVRQWLYNNQLDQITVMAWNPKKSKNLDNNIEIIDNSVGDVASYAEFVYPYPFIRINDKIQSKYMPEFCQDSDVLSKPVRDKIITTGPNENNFVSPWLSTTFINIVAESVFDYPYPYITEKTFKCFWNKSPFIIVGAANSLKYLQSIGFKTFNKWINEDYDSVDDPGLRLNLIFNELHKISKWSINQCQDVYNDMLDVLEHNSTHYYEYYCKTLLKQTIDRINDL